MRAAVLKIKAQIYVCPSEKVTSRRADLMVALEDRFKMQKLIDLIMIAMKQNY